MTSKDYLGHVHIHITEYGVNPLYCISIAYRLNYLEKKIT